MRYLGLGVGHRQSSDFPKEDNILRVPLSGKAYVQVVPKAYASEGATGQEDESGLIDEEQIYLEDDDDTEDFTEEIYEL